MPPELVALIRQKAGGASIPTSISPAELARRRADTLNKEQGNLSGIDCPKCKNRGYFYRVDDQNRTYLEECGCMVARRNRARIARSGLEDMLSRYTMSAYRTSEPWQAKAKELAEHYAQDRRGWFLMAGSVGAGKTHLCTALCGLLMEAGIDTRYMLWRDTAVAAKAVVNDAEEYSRILTPFKRAKALYIDDFFKTGKGQRPSIGDVNLAFELLNDRYNDSRLLTIISTEFLPEELMEIDEALGSRIYERSKGYRLVLNGKKNWRLD